VGTIGGYSEWIQLGGTGSEYSEWIQGVDTIGGCREWIQLGGTVGGYREITGSSPFPTLTGVPTPHTSTTELWSIE